MVPFQEGGFRASHSKRKMFASIRVSEQNVLAYADASARVAHFGQSLLRTKIVANIHLVSGQMLLSIRIVSMLLSTSMERYGDCSVGRPTRGLGLAGNKLIRQKT